MRLLRIESLREVLRAGGFQWSKGTIYAPSGGFSLTKIKQTDPLLEVPYNQAHFVYALDPDHVYTVAFTLDALPIPVPLLIRCPRSSTEFVDVDLQQLLVHTQHICDKEGVLVGKGSIVVTPELARARVADALPSLPVYVAGVRNVGVYVGSFDRNKSIEASVLIINKQLAETFYRLAASDDQEDVLLAVKAGICQFAHEERQRTMN